MGQQVPRAAQGGSAHATGGHAGGGGCSGGGPFRTRLAGSRGWLPGTRPLGGVGTLGLGTAAPAASSYKEQGTEGHQHQRGLVRSSRRQLGWGSGGAAGIGCWDGSGSRSLVRSEQASLGWGPAQSPCPAGRLKPGPILGTRDTRTHPLITLGRPREGEQLAYSHRAATLSSRPGTESFKSGLMRLPSHNEETKLRR